jgi:hypothetical protein
MKESVVVLNRAPCFHCFRPLQLLLLGAVVLVLSANPVQASPVVTGEIRTVDSFLSNNLFAFTNSSTAGENITSIVLQIPAQFFFDTAAAAPGIAPSGPTVGPGSPVTPAFVAPDGSDFLTITFGDFNPGETFQFGVDIDSDAIPDNTVNGAALVGTLATVTFSNGSVLQGEFVDDGIPNNGIAAVLQIQEIPEPTSLALFGVAGLAALGYARRSRKAARTA